MTCERLHLDRKLPLDDTPRIADRIFSHFYDPQSSKLMSNDYQEYLDFALLIIASSGESMVCRSDLCVGRTRHVNEVAMSMNMKFACTEYQYQRPASQDRVEVFP